MKRCRVFLVNGANVDIDYKQVKRFSDGEGNTEFVDEHGESTVFIDRNVLFYIFNYTGE